MGSSSDNLCRWSRIASCEKMALWAPNCRGTDGDRENHVLPLCGGKWSVVCHTKSLFQFNWYSLIYGLTKRVLGQSKTRTQSIKLPSDVKTTTKLASLMKLRDWDPVISWKLHPTLPPGSGSAVMPNFLWTSRRTRAQQRMTYGSFLQSSACRSAAICWNKISGTCPSVHSATHIILWTSCR